MGSASIMRAPNGIPLLPNRLISLLAKTQQGMPVEPVDIIVISKDYETAVSLTLPWAHVVGIVAERSSTDIPLSRVPTVIGIPDIFTLIEDDDLLLVDGDHGIVLVEPDAAAIAAYQAERDNIRPKRRFYLDYVDQNALTLDGKLIHVIASILRSGEQEEGQKNGADAFLFSSGTPLLPADASDDDQHHLFRNIAELADGKPVTVVGDVDALAIHELMRIAAMVETSIGYPIESGMKGFANLAKHIQACADMLLMDDIEFSDIRVAGYIKIESILPEEFDKIPIGRLLIDAARCKEPFTQHQLRWLNALIFKTAPMMIPAEIVLGDAHPQIYEQCLGLGISGFIVPPDMVQKVKSIVRELDASICRSELYGKLKDRSPDAQE
jgi:hypothetical protein